MRRAAALIVGGLVGLVLGASLAGDFFRPRAWRRACLRPGFQATPFEPARDTTRSADPIERDVEALKRAIPDATERDLDEFRRVLRGRGKS